MANDTRKAKLLLEVDTKGEQEAARDLQKLDKEIRNIEEDFRQASKEAGNLKPGGEGGRGGGSVPAAAKFRGAASLFGGGELVGFIDDMQDAIEGVQQFGGSITGLLNPATIAAGVAVGALALIVKDFADGAQKQAEAIDGIFSAQRAVFDEIAGGATRADIEETIAQLQFRRELEKMTLEDATEAYKDYEQQIRNSFGVLGDVILGFLRIIDPREESLNTQKAESEKRIAESERMEKAYQKAIDQGLTAKADARKAEEDLQKSRDKAAQTTDKTTRKEEQRQQEAARAQEQAAREAEQNAQKIAAAQQNYSKAVKDAGTNLRQATQDINTSLKQGLVDNLTSMFRDVADIAETFRRDTFDQDIKAQRDERDALIDHYNELNDLRDEAKQSEQEAIRNGDFKELFLARQKAAQDVQLSEKTASRERQDRQRAASDERADLLTNAQRERSDRLTAFARQNEDVRLAADRELAQARLGKQRQVAMAAEALNAELKMHQNYWASRQQMTAQGLQVGNKTTSTGAVLPAGQFAAPVQAMFAQVLRK